MKTFDKPMYEGLEWTFSGLETAWKAIDEIGKELGLDYYDPQIEVISAEQMLDAYSSVAMPIMYNHWSFGKSFIRNQKAYQRGQMGLAYEVVINTNPTLAYLMEGNSMTMQTLVMAHAVCGHGSFFKNNHLFADGVAADGIIDYLKFAKSYIKDCEDKYGVKRVSLLLDACHALRNFGVDRYKRVQAPKKADLEKRKSAWESNRQEQYDRLMPENTGNNSPKVIAQNIQLQIDAGMSDPELPEGNFLYFIQKYAPGLHEWERELVRIVRKVAQYFYPQMQTQLMNEGWATFIHYTIMNILHDRGAIDEGSYMEFLVNHCGVIAQPPHTQLNVYALGFAMMVDIRRMCENPTDEDKKWCPDVCNTDWMTTMQRIVRDFRDESFVLQYLSPKVIRDLKLCAVYNAEKADHYLISHIHDDEDIREIRQHLSNQYSLANRIPEIDITGVDWTNTRIMYVDYIIRNNQLLRFKDAKETIAYMRYLWGFPIKIRYFNQDGTRSKRTSVDNASESDD